MKTKGFTLVELLLAISLMSMLLALAYGGLRASTRATERGQVILEESGRIRMGSTRRVRIWMYRRFGPSSKALQEASVLSGRCLDTWDLAGLRFRN
jgi:prepilin-type N-terminal cleavage/methylation domain-containing protein